MIYINLDSKPCRRVTTPDKLEALIDLKTTDAEPKYLLIDEVQNVRGYETVFNTYHNDRASRSSSPARTPTYSQLTGRHINRDLICSRWTSRSTSG